MHLRSQIWGFVLAETRSGEPVSIGRIFREFNIAPGTPDAHTARDTIQEMEAADWVEQSGTKYYARLPDTLTTEETQNLSE